MLAQEIRITVITLGISACLTADGTAQQDGAEWPQFRGLTAGAVADDPLLPDRWSTTENVAWAVDISGLRLEFASGGR